MVGGLLGLTAIGVLIFVIRRRKARRNSEIHFIESGTKGPGHISPIMPLTFSEGSTYDSYRYTRSHGTQPSVGGHLTYDPRSSLSYSQTDSGAPWSPGAQTGHSMTFSELGPSASQVGARTMTSSSGPQSTLSNDSNRHGGRILTAPVSVSTKQSAVDDDLRTEVENLRREMERIREERETEAPPSYDLAAGP